MDNNPFMYLVDEALFDNERIFKFSGALLQGDSLTVTFLVRAEDYHKLTGDLKEKLEKTVRELIPDSFELHIVYKKTFTEEKYLISLINGYFYDKSSILFSKLSEDKISFEIAPSLVKIRIGLPPDAFGYAATNEFEKGLAEYLDGLIMEETEVELYRDGSETDVPVVKVHRITRAQGSTRLVNIKVKIPIIGNISKKPQYLVDALKREAESVTVCGTVIKPETLTTKAGKPFFKFSITDTTGSLECVSFTRFEKRLKSLESYFIEGQNVAVEGKMSMNERSARMSLIVRNAVVCDIDFDSIDTSVKPQAIPEDYIKVRPKTYTELEQADMFSDSKKLPDSLRGRFVVFDLETTGLNRSEDKIIEIGAVLVVDGILKETFQTFVNPGMHIPEAASKVNNIYDSDVQGAPNIETAMSDFYLFTRGATLVGHNAEDYDAIFVKRIGGELGFRFDNEIIDTLTLSRRVLPTLRRYKLDTLCEHYGINNENAHRALDDAVATAKVFIMLEKESDGK